MDDLSRPRGRERASTSRVATFAVLAALGLSVGFTGWTQSRQESQTLYSDAVGLDATGQRVSVAPGTQADFVSGTRVFADPHELPATTATLVLDQQLWLAAGTSPGKAGPYAELASSALLDMKVMTLDNGAVLAGNEGIWRYAWPRDSSFVAAAFAATGHLDDAHTVLGFLQEVQADDGTFEARYRTDGRRVGDGRRPQLDGAGWVLWAVGQTVAATPAAERAASLATLRPLVDRSTSAILDSLGPDGLPRPSSDYWERKETSLTLGTAAPLLAGLEAAARLYRLTESGGRADVEAAAQRLREAIVAEFGPAYPRYAGGAHLDAATAMIGRPFLTEALPGSAAALARAQSDLRRPAGGLAPGAGWSEATISWTPETALVAYALAATGDDAGARAWLDWLAAHRTTSGALPEKVLADGSPASVAPLTWTCALVVLTLVELDVAG